MTGDLWAFSWWKGSRRLLAIGNVASDPNDRQEVVMDVGAFKFQVRLPWSEQRNMDSNAPLRLRSHFFRQETRSCFQVARA